MSKPTVACDLDLTLARTTETAAKLLGVDPPLTFSSYTEPFERFGKAAYLNAIWHSWTIRPNEIPPMETDVAEQTARLQEATQTFDVVTAHPSGMMGVDEGKQAWLERHGVSYDSYRSVEGDKQQLGYDYYIDNNPHLVERVNEYPSDATVLLYDQPHNAERSSANLSPDSQTTDNKNAQGEYVRVQTLGDALREITSG